VVALLEGGDTGPPLQFSLSLVHPYEVIDRAVVSLFELGVEVTCRQLSVFPVIVQALTAFMLALARFVGTAAHLFIILHNAFHFMLLLVKISFILPGRGWIWHGNIFVFGEKLFMRYTLIKEA